MLCSEKRWQAGQFNVRTPELPAFLRPKGYADFEHHHKEWLGFGCRRSSTSPPCPSHGCVQATPPVETVHWRNTEPFSCGWLLVSKPRPPLKRYIVGTKVRLGQGGGNLLRINFNVMKICSHKNRNGVSLSISAVVGLLLCMG